MRFTQKFSPAKFFSKLNSCEFTTKLKKKCVFNIEYLNNTMKDKKNYFKIKSKAIFNVLFDQNDKMVENKRNNSTPAHCMHFPIGFSLQTIIFHFL